LSSYTQPYDDNIFVGVDPSGGKKPIAVCVIQGNDIEHHECKTPYAAYLLFERVDRERGSPKIAIEGGFAAANAKHTQALERQRGQLIAHAHHAGAAVCIVHPRTWQSTMLPKDGGWKSKECKRKSIRRALNELGLKLDENAADAYNIARYCQLAYGLDANLLEFVKQ
jgi:Holliday junction resolvasome RuvABC endonuclease subunit